MADHALLDELKERLGISNADHDTKLNRYLSDEEKVRSLSPDNEAEAVVITMFAEADFYRFLSKNTAERIKYHEGNRSVDGTRSSTDYLNLAKEAKETAQDALEAVEQNRGPCIAYLRHQDETQEGALTDDVNTESADVGAP